MMGKWISAIFCDLSTRERDGEALHAIFGDEVQVGQECGMSLANCDDLKADDIIECFSVEKVIRTL